MSSAATSPSDKRIAVLQQIRERGSMTRGALAQRLELSPSQVSRLTGELLAQGLLVDAGRAVSGGGRPSDLLALAPDAYLVVGIELGSSRQRAVVANLRGALLADLDMPATAMQSRAVIIDRIAQLVDEVIARCPFEPARVVGLGLALPALVDPIAGVVHFGSGVPAADAPWTGFPLAAALGERMPGRLVAVDDVIRTLAISEARFGRAERDFTLVLADEGIAAAFVIDGTPYIGPNHVAGELGHVAVDGDTTPCPCGNSGCLELRASSRAILARAGLIVRDTEMLTALRAEPDLAIAAVLDAAEQGDRLAYQLVVEAGEALGHGLALLLNLLGPRLIVLTGALARSAAYRDAALRMMRLRSLSRASQNVQLATSRLDAFAGALGAAGLVLDRLFNDKDTSLLTLRR